MNHPDVSLDTPAYLIARVSIKNGDTGRYMTEYGLPVMPIVAKYQGEVLVASSEATCVEGDAQYNWTVRLRFPNRRLADAWYFSAEYGAIEGVSDEMSTALATLCWFTALIFKTACLK